MDQALRATLILRIIAVVFVLTTLAVREKLPADTIQWYTAIALPLIGFNLAAFFYTGKLIELVERHPLWLGVDLVFSVGILCIGGGWRSSYFEYTLTTIIVFTILQHRRGAFVSSTVLALAAIVKNPLPVGDPVQIFDVTNWDMRLGAAMFYPTAGLILGYFSTFVVRLNQITEERVQKAKAFGAMKQKMDLAFDLHDRLKSKLTAILMVSCELAKKNSRFDPQTAKEIQRQWRWLNYFQSELHAMVDSLGNKTTGSAMTDELFDLCAVAKEEARILSSMTGFRWSVVASGEIFIPMFQKPILSAFIAEALTNSWKYSSVRQGDIRIIRQQDDVRLEIVDHGKGFALHECCQTKTSGLQSLKRRSAELNGDLTIETSPGNGCCYILTFPIISGHLKKGS